MKNDLLKRLEWELEYFMAQGNTDYADHLREELERLQKLFKDEDV